MTDLLRGPLPPPVKIQAIHGIEVPPFNRDDRTVTRLQLHPARVFRPLGFFVWGVNDRTRIGNVICRMEPQPIHNVPARMFETGHSFEELSELAESGEIEVEACKGLTMSTLSPGHVLALEVTGEISAMATWGLELLP